MDFQSKLRSGYYSNDNSLIHKRHTEFIADALKELGLTGHPKAQKLFAKAWDMGHSDGYGGVWYYMCELEELVR